MMEVFATLAILIFVPLAIVMVVMLSGIKDTLRNIVTGQRSMSDRLRRMEDKLSPAPTQPAAAEPAAEPAAPTTAPVQVHEVEPVEVKTHAKPPPIPAMSKPKPMPAPQPQAAPKPEPQPIAHKPASRKLEEPVAPAKPAKPVKEGPTAGDHLRGMWNWIIFGDTKGPNPEVSIEYTLASTWLPRLGIIVVVLAAIFFLNWSIKQGFLSDAARVAFVLASGMGLLIWGMRLLGKKKYRLMGEVFIGGGILTLYAGVFSAGPIFGLIDVQIAFWLMALVTFAAGILSIRANSLLVVIIGLAGAFVTPLLLTEAAQSLPSLYTYILLITFGILGIARYRQWHLLNYLSFLGSYILVLWAITETYKLSDFSVTISFLGVFFVIHSAISYVHNISHGRKSTVLDIIYLVANAILFGVTGYYIIEGAHGRPYPAIMSVSLAIYYIGHVTLFFKRKTVDRPLLITMVALAGAFTAWTLPLLWEKESLTIAFALLAFTFLWIGHKLKSHFVEHLAYVLYMVVFFRLMVFDLHRNFDFRPSTATAMSDYWAAMRERLVTFGSCIASIICAFYVQRRAQKKQTGTLPTGANDIPCTVPRGVGANIFYWFGILFLFLVLHLELNNMFVYREILRLPILTVLWCGMAAYFLARYLLTGRENKALFIAMCVFVIITILKIFVIDLRTWHFSDFIYDMEYHPIYVAARFLDFGVLFIFLFLVWAITLRLDDDRKLAPAFGYGGLLMLFIYASFELNSLLYYKLTDFLAGGISVLWAVFAIAFTGGGIWKNVKPLRYVGLILFLVVFGKVLFHDLRGMEPLYRTIASLTVGIVLLIGSFAYLYSDKKFRRTIDSSSADADKQTPDNEPQ